MKDVNVVVRKELIDVVYLNDVPHQLENLSFIRDKNHNAQMVIYATMSPLIPDARVNYAPLVTDIENQLNPDEDRLLCAACDNHLPDCYCDNPEWWMDE